MPPSRYRVVERGRQLVVIDTRAAAGTRDAGVPTPAGDALNPAVSKLVEPGTAPVSTDRSGMGLLAQAGGSIGDAIVRRDGTGKAEYLDTRRWFDDKGPRRIRLSAAGREQLDVAGLAAMIAIGAVIFVIFLISPFVLLGAAVLLNSKVSAPIRARVTRWIDGMGTTEPA